jgi:hypothetical protein
MKHPDLPPILPSLCIAAGLLLVTPGSATAQFSVNGGAARYNSTRDYNPLRMNFGQAFDVKLSDPVKLIDIAPVLNDREANLLLMVDSTKKGDYRRKLIVSHWDGQRFISDTSIDFFGTNLDSLLVGRFRPAPKAPPVIAPVAGATGNNNTTGANNKKAKKPSPPPMRQIVTTEGIYQWTGGTFARLYSAPPGLKLALTLDGPSPSASEDAQQRPPQGLRGGRPGGFSGGVTAQGATVALPPNAPGSAPPPLMDQMVINSGDNAALFEAGDANVHPSEFQLTGDEIGFPHNGIGTQNFEGLKEFLPGVRYVQTYWRDRYHWHIGVLRGKPNTNLKDQPDATVGDRLVVYVPKAENREKPFWQLVRPDQYEESWRGPEVKGRILDVRVGDARRDGKVGIMVLTAENDDRERHLYYYMPIEGVRPR